MKPKDKLLHDIKKSYLVRCAKSSYLHKKTYAELECKSTSQLLGLKEE